MPQRFLRPGITTSAAWNAISWHAQSFYIRLITLVDDFGRYDARWQILRSHAFPLNDEITQKQMHALCEQLHANDLAVFYRAPDGKEYVQLTKWREKARSEPRFPTFDDTCEQMFAIVNKCSPPSPSPSPSPSPPVQRSGLYSNGETTWEQALGWLEGWKRDGATYTEEETRGSFLALKAGGWMWGRNPIVDPRAALERQIQTDRSKKNGTNQRTGKVGADRNAGTANEKTIGKYDGIS